MNHVQSSYHNVILFGAGASVEAGIPLLNSFVDTMWEYAYRGKVGDKAISERDRDILMEANKIREELERYSSRASFDIRNLEDILSLLSFEALTSEAHAEKYDKVVKAVARTIELSCRIPYRAESPPEPFEHGRYTSLWHALLSPDLREALPALITFNYDLVLERTLWSYFHCYGHARDKPQVASCAVKYNYGMCDFVIKGKIPHTYGTTKGERGEFCYAEIPAVEIPYLKLHGSLNWDRRLPLRSDTGETLRPPSFPTMVVEEPLILPPVFNKMNSTVVNGVWKTALEVLRYAKNIIIVGYSLPRTDIYMQYFLKSAVGPNSSLQRITVFDPILFKDGRQSEEMKQRYLDCFSPQFSGRITFRPPSPFAPGNRDAGTFQHFVHNLKSAPRSLCFYP